MMRDCVTLGVVSLVFLVPGIWDVSLFDRDEGWYAQVTREMLESGDWLIPQYLGEPWLHKPPLLYWCVGASWSLLGATVWAARLVSVLAMAGCVQLIYSLGRLLDSPATGRFAAIGFISAALPAFIGKMILTDSLLLLLTCGAFVAMSKLALHGVTYRRALAFWMCLALAGLAKGPASLLFVAPFALAWLTVGRQRAWIREVRFWSMSLPALPVAAAWFVHIASTVGPEFAGQFIQFEVLDRLRSAPHGHGGPPGYYVALSLAGLLPWTALVPGSLWLAWKSRRVDRLTALLLMWLALPWIALELIPSKLPHYILPCYVPLFLLLGREWAGGSAWPSIQRVLTADEHNVLRIWVAVPVFLSIAVIVVISMWLGRWHWASAATAATLVVGFGGVAWLQRRREYVRAWNAAVATMMIFHATVGFWLLPSFEPYRLSRNIAAVANALAESDDIVVATGYEEPSMFFYIRNTSRALSLDEIQQVMTDARPDVLVILDDVAHESLPLAGRSESMWTRIDGFNYVRMETETVWVGRTDRYSR